MKVEGTDERFIRTEFEGTRFWVFLEQNFPGTDHMSYRDSYRISDATVDEVFAWARSQELEGGEFRVGVEVPDAGYPSADYEVGVVWLGPNAPISS